MLKQVLLFTHFQSGHYKFNTAPYGTEFSEGLIKRIVSLHKDGRGYKVVANTLKLSCSMVAKTIKRFNKTGSTYEQASSGSTNDKVVFCD